MSDINSVIIVGRLIEKPVLKYTKAGTAVLKIRIANNTFVKNPDGSKGNKPNFFDVIVWGKSAENCAKYLDKGRQVAIQGRLEQRKWEVPNPYDETRTQSRYKIEIIAQRVQFIGGKPDETLETQIEPKPLAETAETDFTTEIQPPEETEVVEDFEEPLDDDDVPF